MSPRTLRLRRWTTLLLAVTAVALLAGGAVAAVDPGANGGDGVGATLASADAQDEADPLVESCATEMPEDYGDPAGDTADTIGWVDGYWYDEPIDVNATDGLSEAELDRVSARTAARVEAMRCLPFEDGLPPIDVRTRAEHANQTETQYANVSDRAARISNAQLSTLLMVGDDADAVNVTRDLVATGVGGFYEPETDRIVLVKPEGGSAPIDEITLFQELGHALQDQQFNLSGSESMTADEDNAWRGVVEGDMNWLDYRFQQRCTDGRWSEPCILPDDVGGASDGGDSGGDGEGGSSASAAVPNWGVALEFQYPYLEGPPFVRQVYQDGGWDAVNELYADVPETSLEVTDPDAAEGTEFVDPEVDVEPGGEWEQLTDPSGSDTAELGQAWIASAFMAPSWESDTEGEVVNQLSLVNFGADGEVQDVGGITYDPAPAMGWRGDRMAFYERGEDTATVWNTAWANGSEAEEFVAAYEELLEIRGASTAEGYANVYTFGEASGFEGAVAIATDGDRVTIVSAPAVDALTQVAPEIELATAAEDGSEAGSDTGGDENGSANDGGDDSDSLPGFGVVVALLGALAGVGLLARRNR